MTSRARRLAPFLGPAFLAAACSPRAPVSPPPARVPVVRRGPDRGQVLYAEREPAAKAALFARINAERAASRVPPLAYDLLGAEVGDVFCLDAARSGSLGHWDTAGRAPYLRWALAGGVDYHAENVGSFSRAGDPITPREVGPLLMELHQGMMAERPPDDGHRRTVLNPQWTHVGIGFAAAGGELRMTEEYSRRVAEWVEVPVAPLPPGSVAPFALRLPQGWSVAQVEVAFEPFPKPLTVAQTRRRGAYRYPRPVTWLLPRLGDDYRYPDGQRGNFSVAGGLLQVGIPLLSGPGHYYVLVFAGEGDVRGRELAPVTAALIVAGH